MPIVGVRDDIGDIHYWCTRDPGIGEHRHQVVAAVLGNPLADQFVQFILVVDASAVRRETLVLHQLRTTHQFAETHEETLRSGVDRDTATVGSGEVAGRNNVEVPVPSSLTNGPIDGVVEQGALAGTEACFVEREVDDLPSSVSHISVVQRGDHRERAEIGRHVVDDRVAGPDWRALREAAHVSESGERARYSVEGAPVTVRAGEAVSRDVERDEVRKGPVDRFGIQSPRMQGWRSEVDHEDVEMTDELPQQFTSSSMVQIERDGTLVARFLDPLERATARTSGAPPDEVPNAWRFHLHDLGAEVGKHRCGNGGGEYGRHVQHPHTGERS